MGWKNLPWFQVGRCGGADGTSDPFVLVANGDNRSNPDLHERVINQIILDGHQ